MKAKQTIKKAIKKPIEAALAFLSQKILQKHKPKIVAITGSVGKTTTKEAIAKALSVKYKTEKTYKSFNSEIGIPLTIFLHKKSPWSSPIAWVGAFYSGVKRLLANDYPEVLVIEAGVDSPGDMEKTLKILGKPDIAVITALPKFAVHSANFPNPEDIAEEKLKLTYNAEKTIANYQDEKIRTTLSNKSNTKFYGKGSEFYLKSSKIIYKDSFPTGMAYQIQAKDFQFEVVLKNVLGDHFSDATVAALAVADEFGIELEKAAEALKDIKLEPGRMRIFQGKNSTVLIDDSYNASYIATVKALELLDKLHSKGRKIFVFADMLELAESRQAHEKIGKKAAEVADVFFTIGENTKHAIKVAQKIMQEQKKFTPMHFNSHKELQEALQATIAPGDIVLIKGSQGYRMEKITKHLLANPEDAKFLPRQEKNWQKI